MKKNLLTLLLILPVASLVAQNKVTDQLKQVIQTHTQPDTFRVNHLNLLALSFELAPNEREQYAREALAIAEKIDYEKGKAYALIGLGTAFISLGEKVEVGRSLFQKADSIGKSINDVEIQAAALWKLSTIRVTPNATEALQYGLQAEALAQRSTNKRLLSEIQGGIGDIYQRSLSDYSKAMEYGIKSVSTAEKAGCNDCLVDAWANLANLYTIIGDRDKALIYYQKAFEANKQSGNISMSGTLLNYMGEIYRLTARYTEAIAAYKECLKVIRVPYHIEVAESNLADVYVRLDSIESAFYYGFKSLKGATQLDDEEGLSWIDGILSRAYLKKKMPDSALHYAAEGLAIAKKTGTIEFMRDNAKALSDAYQYKNDFKNAFDYYTQYITYRDSVLNAEVNSKSALLTYNYDLEKKQAQITSLSQQKKLQENFLISLSVVLLLIITGSIVLMRNYRQKRSALTELKQTQTQLVHAAKMASLGELTAGIAHEIQNPLNFVNNFSEVNKELVEELKSELSAGNLQSATEIVDDIQENSGKINHHGKRADAIVKGMLQHSRNNSGVQELTDINALADENVRLAYNGFRAKEKFFSAELRTEFDPAIKKINLVAQDIARVLLNLYNNAFYAMNEKVKQEANGYEPVLSVSTAWTAGKVIITVKDNGIGIPPKIADKIFQPFFTTKPTGEGTGLGLSLAYDMVKAHGGEINVSSVEKEGTTFTVVLRG